MACSGGLSPVTLIAGTGLLQNVGLDVAKPLTDALNGFNGQAVTNQFSKIVTDAANVLSNDLSNELRKVANDIFPAVTNALPAAAVAALASVAPAGVFAGGFTGLVQTAATNLMGGGDLSKFAQIATSARGYLEQANQFINSSLNVDQLSATFSKAAGGMDNLITGGFSQVSQASGALGQDLADLGVAIDPNNLAGLGTPSALFSQLVNVGGVVPVVESALKDVGLSISQIAKFGEANFPGIAASLEKSLYEGMTKITGAELDQVKKILNVTTPNIDNMAQLLDPTKILPNSYTTLTTPDINATVNGLRGIFDPITKGVDSTLEKLFNDPNAEPYTGDDPYVRARLKLQNTTVINT